MAERFAEALDLVLAPLREREPETALTRSGAPELHRERAGRAVVQSDTAPPPLEIALRDLPFHEHLVDARQRVAGMEQPVRERAVIGEEQGALDVPVQAPDRIEAHVTLH